jgi:radical SAM superfamily enzyme YgiQ (UPF0313 family)
VIPIQIAYSASLLKRNGYEVEVIDNRTEFLPTEDLLKAIIKKNPKIIFIDCTSPEVNVLKRLAHLIKNSSSSHRYIFAMGQHATVLPEDLLREDGLIDAGILGEPEYTISELVDLTPEIYNNRMTLDSVKGIAYFDKSVNKVKINPKRDPIRNLDDLPFLDYTLFKADKYKKLSAQVSFFSKERWGFVLSSRGCPYRCSFCSPVLRHSYGHELSFQSAKRIVDEMEYQSKQFGVNAISFEDDNFSFDRQRVIDICNEIIKRRLKIRWVAQVHLNQIFEGMVYKMKEAGCDTLRAGVESGSPRILDILNKDLDMDGIRKSCASIKKAKITLTLFFMINNPSETYSEMLQTLRFAKELNPAMLHVYFCTPYPGSQIYDNLKTKINDFSSFCHYDRIGYNLCRADLTNVEKFQKIFYRDFFLSPRYLVNYMRYRGRYNLFKRDEWILLLKAVRYIYG